MRFSRPLLRPPRTWKNCDSEELCPYPLCFLSIPIPRSCCVSREATANGGGNRESEAKGEDGKFLGKGPSGGALTEDLDGEVHLFSQIQTANLKSVYGQQQNRLRGLSSICCDMSPSEKVCSDGRTSAPAPSLSGRMRGRLAAREGAMRWLFAGGISTILGPPGLPRRRDSGN